MSNADTNTATTNIQSTNTFPFKVYKLVENLDSTLEDINTLYHKVNGIPLKPKDNAITLKPKETDPTLYKEDLSSIELYNKVTGKNLKPKTDRLSDLRKEADRVTELETKILSSLKTDNSYFFVLSNCKEYTNVDSSLKTDNKSCLHYDLVIRSDSHYKISNSGWIKTPKLHDTESAIVRREHLVFTCLGSYIDQNPGLTLHIPEWATKPNKPMYNMFEHLTDYKTFEYNSDRIVFRGEEINLADLTQYKDYYPEKYWPISISIKQREWN